MTSDSFRIKAERWRGLAERARDPADRAALASIADAFDEMAREAAEMEGSGSEPVA